MLGKGGSGDDDERLDVLLSSSLLVRRYNSFSLKSAILMYKMLGLFCYLLRFLYPLGVQNGSVLFESLFHGCEYLIRQSQFCNFFLLFWFSFWVTGLLRLLLPTAIT